MCSILITKNLIGLQDLIIKNVEHDETSIYIYVQMPRKTHTGPCCRKDTGKVHDYRKQQLFANFILPKTLPDVLAIDEFKGNAGKEKYQ